MNKSKILYILFGIGKMFSVKPEVQCQIWFKSIYEPH